MQVTTKPQMTVQQENSSGLIAPISGQSLAMYKAQITNGIRQVYGK